MSIEQILAEVRSFDGVLVLAPDEDSTAPAIAWGDFFFYYAPDGQVPMNEQPYATIVTKNYPDDTESDLDGEGRYRVNVHVGRSRFEQLIGENPHAITDHDYAIADTVIPHPVYGPLGWVSVVNPGEQTHDTVLGLLRDAHASAKARAQRHAARRGG